MIIFLSFVCGIATVLSVIACGALYVVYKRDQLRQASVDALVKLVETKTSSELNDQVSALNEQIASIVESLSRVDDLEDKLGSLQAVTTGLQLLRR